MTAAASQGSRGAAEHRHVDGRADEQHVADPERELQHRHPDAEHQAVEQHVAELGAHLVSGTHRREICHVRIDQKLQAQQHPGHRAIAASPHVGRKHQQHPDEGHRAVAAVHAHDPVHRTFHALWHGRSAAEGGGNILGCRHARDFSQPTSRCSASRYFSAVFAITSVGSRGAGGVLFQGFPSTCACSSQSRRNCLSKLGGFWPAASAAS